FTVPSQNGRNSLRSVRRKERSAFFLVWYVSRQQQAELGHRIELLELLSDEDSSYRADIARQVGFDRDNAGWVGRLDDLGRPFLAGNCGRRQGCHPQAVEPGGGALPPCGEELVEIAWVVQLLAEQFVKVQHITCLPQRPFDCYRRQWSEEACEIALDLAQQFGLQCGFVR